MKSLDPEHYWLPPPQVWSCSFHIQQVCKHWWRQMRSGRFIFNKNPDGTDDWRQLSFAHYPVKTLDTKSDITPQHKTQRSTQPDAIANVNSQALKLCWGKPYCYNLGYNCCQWFSVCSSISVQGLCMQSNRCIHIIV